MKDLPDQLYAKPRDSISGFSFDENVASVFTDMIQRSVPGYQTILHMIGQMAHRYAINGSTLYDLGCSLGGATLAMHSCTRDLNCQIKAIDNSQAMLKKFAKVLNSQPNHENIELLCDDIQYVEIQQASVCVLNFTLQFIAVDQRQQLIQKIYDGMQPGGVLLLSEKIAFEHSDYNQLMIDLYHNFKQSNGYSELEIAQKRTALENVLIPETLATHKTRLLNAGFQSFDCWFQCFNFASMIAFK